MQEGFDVGFGACVSSMDGDAPSAAACSVAQIMYSPHLTRFAGFAGSGKRLLREVWPPNMM
jgi:hypothetical protein